MGWRAGVSGIGKMSQTSSASFHNPTCQLSHCSKMRRWKSRIHHLITAPGGGKQSRSQSQSQANFQKRRRPFPVLQFLRGVPPSGRVRNPPPCRDRGACRHRHRSCHECSAGETVLPPGFSSPFSCIFSHNLYLICTKNPSFFVFSCFACIYTF